MYPRHISRFAKGTTTPCVQCGHRGGCCCCWGRMPLPSTMPRGRPLHQESQPREGPQRQPWPCSSPPAWMCTGPLLLRAPQTPGVPPIPSLRGSSPRSSSTSFLPPPPGTNAGAFAFMVLYLCVSLRSDWNEVTGLPLLEKVKTSSIIFSIITTATAMVE